MKHKTIRLLAIALLSSTLLAQLAQGRGGHGPGGTRSSRIDFLATVLSLTDEQKQQATAIFEAAETASAPVRENLALQRQALTDAAKSNAAEVTIDQLAATLGNTSGQLAAIQTKAFASFYALLTTEQKTKFDQLETHERGMKASGIE